MAKVPKIEDVATLQKHRGNYATSYYKCKFCGATLESWYNDMKNIRSHMRRKHASDYYATVEFIIQEEEDHLWTMAK